MKPLHLDTDEFTRLAASQSGLMPLNLLSRLCSMLSDTEGELVWHLSGLSRSRTDGSVARELRLSLHGRVRLICSRCLRPRDFELEVDRGYVLAGSEEEASRLDNLSDESDVLVGGRRFNVSELIEDEAILALPVVVTHADCRLRIPDGFSETGPSGGAVATVPGGNASASAPAGVGVRKPFAALAGFKAKQRS